MILGPHLVRQLDEHFCARVAARRRGLPSVDGAQPDRVVARVQLGR
jgi:hypothetical protein